MKILIVTDAWHPQVNGVVRTLGQVAQEATNFGVPVAILSPAEFRTVPMPSYPEIRLALTGPGAMERRLEAIAPDAIHIATEGPLGHAMRRVCIRRGLPFTTSFHTRFPDYVAERVTIAPKWSGDLTWAWLRRFHSQSAAVLAATPTLVAELEGRGFRNVKLWQRGVDAALFHPERQPALGGGLSDLPRPIFLTVGRVAVEKNLEEFLKLDLPGTKLVVGDGPARDHLTKKYPGAVFVGAKHGAELADIYAAADVFVFPSRTDTFGLVLLEALASGVPVAAFPAAAPRDVIGSAPVGCLDEDLKAACLTALALDRAACRDFARGLTWEATARTFVKHVTEATQKPRRRRDRDRAAA
ncbi:alpha-mannosyltransferase [Pseudolabrys sp. Root1462]|jgi:glycosyltransferase involved in cell wall biosynthesis|uniref:glycosyltransferase family 4 protein n=1 Tax=Pseudolabrys sp. Root1462 TaxID=1736466 RepID=UPI0007023E94|nr:glycosyltransferase family 1 protein [Pseudolabrys sp. Root1462]KQZ00202.1 alpha-mannosyltransferase [Pseudolabrys sp. Root1462]